MLPDKVVRILEQLQDEVPPFSATQAEKIISQNIGKPLRHVFKRFDRTPIGSASLAQVHSALSNNRKVVIKILRPGLAQRVHKNLKKRFISLQPLLTHSTQIAR